MVTPSSKTDPPHKTSKVETPTNQRQPSREHINPVQPVKITKELRVSKVVEESILVEVSP